MPEPITLLGSVIPVIVGDVYTRTITGMVNDHKARLKKLEEISTHIAQAIDAQNQGYFETARLALDRDDIGDALVNLARGLPLVPHNAQGWMDYASLLTLTGHDEAAKKVWKDMVDWFGVDCPCFPKPLRQELQPHDKVVIQSDRPIERVILSGIVAGKIKNAAVSDSGAVAAFYHTTGYIRTKADIKVQFHPWADESTQSTIYEVEKDPIPYSREVPDLKMTAMTKRFVVIDDRMIIDLRNPSLRTITTTEKVHAAFGNNNPGVVEQVGTSVKGVSTEAGLYAVSNNLHSSTFGRYIYSTPNNGAKLIVRPEVYKSQQR